METASALLNDIHCRPARFHHESNVQILVLGDIDFGICSVTGQRRRELLHALFSFAARYDICDTVIELPLECIAHDAHECEAAEEESIAELVHGSPSIARRAHI